MATIKHSKDLPQWFGIRRYGFKPTSEQDMHGAALAVLDRIPFYQTIMSQSFDPTTLDGTACGAALSALQAWSENPYQRITKRGKKTLQEALQPTVSNDTVRAFETYLKREEAFERVACQFELRVIVAEVRHLPASEQRQAMLAEIGRRLQREKCDREWSSLLKPVAPSWVRKLFDYRIAAYMDLAIWTALVGRTPDIKGLHKVCCLDGHDDRSVAKLLRELQDSQHLQYRARIEHGGAFDALQRNRKKGKGDTRGR